MKIEIEIPEPKFQKGDVLLLTTPAGFHGPVHVIGVGVAGGTWSLIKGVARAQVGVSSYVYVYQEGCVAANGVPIRPGMIGASPWPIFEEMAEKIAWDKPLVTQDTEQNVRERDASWKAAVTP
jgi:hypothetical protein